MCQGVKVVQRGMGEGNLRSGGFACGEDSMELTSTDEPFSSVHLQS